MDHIRHGDGDPVMWGWKAYTDGSAVPPGIHARALSRDLHHNKSINEKIEPN